MLTLNTRELPDVLTHQAKRVITEKSNPVDFLFHYRTNVPFNATAEKFAKNPFKKGISVVLIPRLFFSILILDVHVVQHRPVKLIKSFHRDPFHLPNTNGAKIRYSHLRL